jgi:hypothetical protein
MRDIRKRVKAERAYYQRDELQQCTVCGRLFVRRKDTVCSMSCKAEADAPVECVTTEQEGRHQ